MLDLDERLAGLVDDLERPVLGIVLDLLVRELATNETLEAVNGVRRVDDGLTLGGQTDQTLTVLGESDDGGCRPRTLRVFDDP